MSIYSHLTFLSTKDSSHSYRERSKKISLNSIPYLFLIIGVVQIPSSSRENRKRVALTPRITILDPFSPSLPRSSPENGIVPPLWTGGFRWGKPRHFERATTSYRFAGGMKSRARGCPRGVGERGSRVSKGKNRRLRAERGGGRRGRAGGGCGGGGRGGGGGATRRTNDEMAEL